MTHDETLFAAQVTNHELSATRSFLDKIANFFAILIAPFPSDSVRNAARADVYEDLYYPNETVPQR